MVTNYMRMLILRIYVSLSDTTSAIILLMLLMPSNTTRVTVGMLSSQDL